MIDLIVERVWLFLTVPAARFKKESVLELTPKHETVHLQGLTNLSILNKKLAVLSCLLITCKKYDNCKQLHKKKRIFMHILHVSGIDNSIVYG